MVSEEVEMSSNKCLSNDNFLFGVSLHCEVRTINDRMNEAKLLQQLNNRMKEM